VLVALALMLTVIATVAVSPTRTEGKVPTETDERVGAAFTGTIDKRPKPNAETATSAIRLSVVFIDICFLSIVDPRTFLGSAW